MNYEAVVNWIGAVSLVIGAAMFRHWLDLRYERKHRITGDLMAQALRIELVRAFKPAAAPVTDKAKEG